MPFIKGMPLDVEHSFEGVLNGPDERYAEWLWMMYGHMAPTQEELMHMLLSMAGMIPILGTAADVYNAYLYYIEGDAVNFLISAGVVIVSAVGDYLLIKDIASEVKFAFSKDARSKLALIPDSSVDAATKRAIIEYLDDVEGAGKYTNSQIDDIIKNLKGDGFKNNPLRQAYENEVAGLAQEGQQMLKQGMSEEQVARTLNQMRRDLGIKYKDATPQPLRDYIYEINQGRYQDPLGPTYESMIREGKTNAQIIESSARSNPDIDKLLSGFEQWLRGQ